MPHGKNVAVVMYDVDTGNKEILFRIKPLVNFRSIYELMRKTISFRIEGSNKSVRINSGNEFLLISSDKCDFSLNMDEEMKKWYWNFFYEVDAEREEDVVENCYNPGSFVIKIKGHINFYITTSFCDDELYDAEKLYETEIERRQELLETFFSINKVPEKDWVKWLVLAADMHVIETFDKKPSIIAGYHWFGEWGRDTMISLPGLCLKTGRLKEAKGILENYSKYIKDGLLPNMFPVREGEKTSYNSADGSLWFVNCVYLYYQKTKDKKFVKDMWSVIIGIIEKYVEGTNGIKMDNDFLIKHGPGLTWMDAKVDGRFITPREGKAVEIQALWYNCLCIAEFFAKMLKKDYRKYQFHDNQAKKSFNEKFWNGEYLRDNVNDDTLRPNQLIAIDLPFPIVDESKSKRIIEVVKKNLWTEKGLRTLSRSDKNYHGTYTGGLAQRDEAYHQGTIWPWLSVLVSDKKWIEKFVEDEVMRFGLGTICEIIDGDEPHNSKGCISQAWSIGKILESV